MLKRLSLLVLPLVVLAGFLAALPASARTVQRERVAPLKSKKLSTTRRTAKIRRLRKSKSKSKYARRDQKTLGKHKWQRRKKRHGAYVSSYDDKSRRARKYSRNLSWSSKRRKLALASLHVEGIKNLRHAKLTARGRMSVAKDTRRQTIRRFARRVSLKYRPGTVVLSNYTRRLYYVVRPGKVIAFPIATPRPEEVWSGKTYISEKKINPDWYPTPAMREKNPSLPEKVPGGSPANPFGKRALYLGKSFYRIHGTNRPGSIGKSASGGCYRMYNRDIRKLFRLVHEGTPVVVLASRQI